MPSRIAQGETAAVPANLFSEAERTERAALGLPFDRIASPGCLLARPVSGTPVIPKRAVRAPDVLNEATDYLQPASFSRGLRVEPAIGAVQIFLSGTASVDADGRTVYPGDFRAQCWRTYRNLTRLLAREMATWRDVVRCTCYLSDIERDYAVFNAIRTEFFQAMALDPLPASTCVGARLCRPNLLVEIQVDAILGGRNPHCDLPYA